MVICSECGNKIGFFQKRYIFEDTGAVLCGTCYNLTRGENPSDDGEESAEAPRWLASTINYYRKLGFLEKFKGLSDEKLANKMITLAEEDEQPYYFTTESENHEADAYLIHFDEDRVWALSHVVGKGEDTYIEIIKNLGKISLGKFNPTQIKETWKGESGPITVEFMLNKKKITLKPEWFSEDCPDTRIIGEINKLIKSTGYRFIAFEGVTPNAYAILKITEAEKIKNERCFEFE